MQLKIFRNLIIAQLLSPAISKDGYMSTVQEDYAMLFGSCHCGAVTIELPFAPESATSCNCSMCRRLGGVWAYYAFGTVKITGHPVHTQEYVQGDKTLRTIRCKTCGCVTHWEPLNAELGSRHGVNLRNFDPKLLAAVPVRRFDGADTWKFLN